MRSRRQSSHLAATLSAALIVTAGLAGPASAQMAGLPLPTTPVGELPIGDLGDLSALPAIPGLDPLNPVLGTVTGLVGGLTDQLGPLLSQVPLANTLQFQGTDVVDAAIAFSQATFPTAVIAMLGRDDLFADSLAAGGLQGQYQAPLLLSGGSQLDPRVTTELTRLGAQAVTILGSQSAISGQVEQQLRDLGLTVYRGGGATRIETASFLAGASRPGATTAVLTRAYESAGGDPTQAYADVLSVSPWAAENGWPVLLTQTDTLTSSVRDFLRGSTISEIVLIGGGNAISPAVEQALSQMGIATRRVAGPNRYATAVEVARARGLTGPGDADRLILTEGANILGGWAPGFAAAGHGFNHNAPILLTNGATLPPETLEFLTQGLDQNLLDGGPMVICAAFVTPVACEAAGLLMMGALTPAMELLGLGLGDLPIDVSTLTGVLRGLGLDLSGLSSILSGLGVPLVGGLLDGGLLDGATGGGIGGVVDTVTGVVDSVTGVTGGDITAPVGAVVGVVGGLLGG